MAPAPQDFISASPASNASLCIVLNEPCGSFFDLCGATTGPCSYTLSDVMDNPVRRGRVDGRWWAAVGGGGGRGGRATASGSVCGATGIAPRVVIKATPVLAPSFLCLVRQSHGQDRIGPCGHMSVRAT